jgi:hypothetical protein
MIGDHDSSEKAVKVHYCYYGATGLCTDLGGKGLVARSSAMAGPGCGRDRLNVGPATEAQQQAGRIDQGEQHKKRD